MNMKWWFALASLLLAGCGTQSQPVATLAGSEAGDLAAISTAAVATIYANLTLSAATPQPSAANEVKTTPQTAAPTIATTPNPIPVSTAEMKDKFNVIMRLVPAGPFQYSTIDGTLVQVTLDDFYIDIHEVTNFNYMVCVHAGACTAPKVSKSSTHPNYYLNPAYGSYPVISIGWKQAVAYCTWRGTRLPTETEWEKAALGTDGRIFPWGSAAPDSSHANLCDSSCSKTGANTIEQDDHFADVAPVGSFPAGASPYGILDLVGNVSEWVISGDPGQKGFAHRGGSWKTLPAEAGLKGVVVFETQDNFSALDIGFRCALSVNEN